MPQRETSSQVANCFNFGVALTSDSTKYIAYIFVIPGPHPIEVNKMRWLEC